MRLPLAPLAALCLLGLASCSSLSALSSVAGSTTVSSAQVQVAVNAFDGAEIAASGAISYCTGKPMPKPCTVAGVTSLHSALVAGRTARANLESFAASNTGGASLTSAYNALVAATTTINAIAAQYGAR